MVGADPGMQRGPRQAVWAADDDGILGRWPGR